MRPAFRIVLSNTAIIRYILILLHSTTGGHGRESRPGNCFVDHTQPVGTKQFRAYLRSFTVAPEAKESAARLQI